MDVRAWPCVLGYMHCLLALYGSLCALPACLWAAMSHVFCRQSTGFSAVVSAAFHSESLIVELVCIPPPLFFLDSSNLIISPSLTSPSESLLLFPSPAWGFCRSSLGTPFRRAHS